MRPDVHSPARALTRTESGMHSIMAELVAAGRFPDAHLCRTELAGVSARRSRAAAIELDAATAERRVTA